MTKKIFFITFLFAALLHAPIASAELKIGYYNNRQVLDNLPLVQKELEKLSAEFAPKQKEITDMEAELKKMNEDNMKNAPVLSTTEKQSRELDFQSKRRELQLLAEDTKREFDVRRNDIARQLQTLVEQEVLKVAQEENFDLILRSGVIHAGPKVDITQKILQRLSDQ